MCETVKKLRVAVIGCGRISVMHLGSIAMMKDAELVACCDIVPERADAAAKKYGAKAYYDYETMLDGEQLDAIHICLPHYLHCLVAQAAIRRGVAVLSEKPMDVSYEAAEETVRLAKEKGVLYGVIFQCRYNNSVKLVKKAVESGKLGKILSVRSVLTWNRPNSYYSGSNWKGTWDKEGGGVVIDQAIHTFDLVNWIVNSPIKGISCTLSKRSAKCHEVEDTAEGLIEFENGAKYVFFCSNNYAVDEPIEIKMVCEKGRVVFGYDDAYITYDDGSMEEAHQSDVQEYEGGKDYWGFQHVRQIRQFYDACLGKAPLDISGEEALKTHRMICDIYKTGRKFL